MIKKIFEYLFGKAAELLVTFSVLAVIATELSPEKYAVVAMILILINASTFLYSVPSSVYLKGRSLRYNSTGSMAFLISASLVMLVILIAVLWIYAVRSDFFYYMFILIGNMSRTITQTYLRVEIKVRTLNVYNMVYPIFLALFFLVAYFYYDEFHATSVLQAFSLAFLMVLLCSIVVGYSVVKGFDIPLKRMGIMDARVLVKYLFIQGGAFLLLYSERLIVINTQEASSVGGFQLMDNFILIPFMLISTLLYIIQPIVMSSERYRGIFLRLYLPLVFSGLAILLVMYLIYKTIIIWVVSQVFPDYEQYTFILGYSLASKLFVLLGVVPSLVLIISNMEMRMIVVQWGAVVLGGLSFFYCWNELSIQEIITLNLSVSVLYCVTSVIVAGQMMPQKDQNYDKYK